MNTKNISSLKILSFMGLKKILTEKQVLKQKLSKCLSKKTSSHLSKNIAGFKHPFINIKNNNIK